MVAGNLDPLIFWRCVIVLYFTHLGIKHITQRDRKFPRFCLQILQSSDKSARNSPNFRANIIHTSPGHRHIFPLHSSKKIFFLDPDRFVLTYTISHLRSTQSSNLIYISEKCIFVLMHSCPLSHNLVWNLF